MEIAEVVEHEDGGATYTFDMTDDERELMLKSGFRDMKEDPEDHCGRLWDMAHTALSEFGLACYLGKEVEEATDRLEASVLELALMTAIVKGIKSAETKQTTSAA